MAGLSATSSGEQRLRFGNFDDDLDAQDDDSNRLVTEPTAKQAVSPAAEGRTVRYRIMQQVTSTNASFGAGCVMAALPDTDHGCAA